MNKDETNDVIIDTRFNTYGRFYIRDILNGKLVKSKADLDQYFQNYKYDIVKINQVYVNKVAICGFIVSVFESEKFYRLKVDDSTGSILVTLWKNLTFNESSLGLFSNNSRPNSIKNEHAQVYESINSIQKLVKDKTVNNSIMYEPVQGHLVYIRASIRSYNEKISLNAASCVRVQNSTEELAQIMLPAVLAQKVYSTKTQLSPQEYENLKNAYPKPVVDSNVTFSKNCVDEKIAQQREKTVQFVYEKLNDFYNKQNENAGTEESKSCQIQELHSHIKINSSATNDLKFLNFKQLLDALKELELRGLAYSCEDEFHYLPIV